MGMCMSCHLHVKCLSCQGMSFQVVWCGAMPVVVCSASASASGGVKEHAQHVRARDPEHVHVQVTEERNVHVRVHVYGVV